MYSISWYMGKMGIQFNEANVKLNGTFHLSPHENILTIALINIHYLYNRLQCFRSSKTLHFSTFCGGIQKD